MAWIESHQSLWRHPKTQRAARLAGVGLHEIIGLLHCLWWWCLDYAEDGNLARYEKEDVEAAVGWLGEPGKLYDAFVAAAFIDLDDQVHDWQGYAGRLLEKRADARKRAQASRERNAHAARSVHPYNQHQPTNTNQPTNQPKPTPTTRTRKNASAEEMVVVEGATLSLLPELWQLLLDDLGIVVRGKREEVKQHDLATVAAWNCWFQAHNAQNKKHPLGAGVVINRIHDDTPLPGEEWLESGKEWIAEKLQELTSDDTAVFAAAWNSLFPQDRFLTEDLP